MTKLSNRLRNELTTLKWFIPSWAYTPSVVTAADELSFAAWSSHGKKLPNTPGTEALKWAKTYREVHIGYWKFDMNRRLITIDEILADMPSEVQRYTRRALGTR